MTSYVFGGVTGKLKTGLDNDILYRGYKPDARGFFTVGVY